MAGFIGNVFRLFEFEANQAYDSFMHFYGRRNEGSSFSWLLLEADHVGKMYQGLSDHMSFIEGMEKVEKGCSFIYTSRNLADKLDGYKLQAVIGTYGMLVLNGAIDKRWKESEGRIPPTSDSFLDAVVLNQGEVVSAPNSPIMFEGRTYQQLRHDVENVVRAKRFDLMKQGMDEVREKYPFRL